MQLTKEQHRVLSEIIGQTVTQEKFNEFFKDDLSVIQDCKLSVKTLSDDLRKIVKDGPELYYDEMVDIVDELKSTKKLLRTHQLKVDSGISLLNHLGIKITAG